MTNVILFLMMASLIVIILVVYSVLRLSRLKKKRTMGRSLSRNSWFDKQLLKRFAKNFPRDD